jgi:hypothetical protein
MHSHREPVIVFCVVFHDTPPKCILKKHGMRTCDIALACIHPGATSSCVQPLPGSSIWSCFERPVLLWHRNMLPKGSFVSTVARHAAPRGQSVLCAPSPSRDWLSTHFHQEPVTLWEHCKRLLSIIVMSVIISAKKRHYSDDHR